MHFTPNFKAPRSADAAGEQEGFRLETDVPVPMRDGTILFTDLYHPLTGAPHPVLLERTPYGKHSSVMVNIGAPQYLARNGYVVAIQDTRGRFTSEGDWYPFRDEGWGERRDGQDTIEWLARQPFSSGKVGTFGGSYAGFNQYTMAGAMPPSLAATFPRQSPCSLRREWVYRGGALELGFIGLRWARRMGVEALRNRSAQYDRLAERAVLDWPMPNHPLLSDPYQWFQDYVRRQEDKDYWKQFDVEPHHAAFDRPSFHVASWFDIFCGGSLRNFIGIRAAARSETIRKQHKLVIGPWIHGPFMYREPEGRWVGEMDCSTAAFWDYNAEMKSWFDQHLKGVHSATLDGPAVRYFVMGSNQWKESEDWPPSSIEYRKLYLTAGPSGTSPSANDGSLSWNPPVDPGSPGVITHDPANPIPSVGGATLFTVARAEAAQAESWQDINAQAGSRDQHSIEARCLTYTSDVLDRDLEITGPVLAYLFVSSTGVDADFVVRLCDVYPDGRSMLLCDGIQRMRYRNSDYVPALLEPGRMYEVEVDLWATSNRFRRGHRLRVIISNSCFPRFDINPGTGKSSLLSEEQRITSNTVFTEPSAASFLLLPIDP